MKYGEKSNKMFDYLRFEAKIQGEILLPSNIFVYCYSFCLINKPILTKICLASLPYIYCQVWNTAISGKKYFRFYRSEITWETIHLGYGDGCTVGWSVEVFFDRTEQVN